MQSERGLGWPPRTVEPLEGAQVVFEATALAKKEVSPHGLIFLAGQQVTSPGPLDPVGPLAEKSLAGLRTAVLAGGAGPGDVLRGTCFLSSLDGLAKIREGVAVNFPAGISGNSRSAGSSSWVRISPFSAWSSFIALTKALYSRSRVFASFKLSVT